MKCSAKNMRNCESSSESVINLWRDFDYQIGFIFETCGICMIHSSMIIPRYSCTILSNSHSLCLFCTIVNKSHSINFHSFTLLILTTPFFIILLNELLHQSEGKFYNLCQTKGIVVNYKDTSLIKGLVCFGYEIINKCAIKSIDYFLVIFASQTRLKCSTMQLKFMHHMNNYSTASLHRILNTSLFARSTFCL